MNDETVKRGIESLKAIGEYNTQLIRGKLKDAKIASEYMSDIEADNLIVFTKEETENILTQLATLQARVRELEEQIERQNQSMKRLRGDNQLDQQEGIDF